MAHHNTVFVQLLRFLPRHEFEAEARQHQRGQGLRVMSRWAQFVALGLAQLTGRQSLRDIVSNLSTQQPVEEVCSLSRPVQAAWR